MTLTTGPFPYDIENLLGGAVRVLYADASGANDPGIPTGIHDVIAMTSTMLPQADWTDLGATKDAFSYGRGFETEGYEIQQVAGNVIEELTNIERSFTVSVAEFRPEVLRMIENAPAPEAIAAAANQSAQTRIPFGSFTSLERYRFAFIAMRPKAAGVVTEPGGATRGRLFMGVANQAQIAADEVTFDQAKGELTAAEVTFTLFPDSAADSGEEHGAWYDEAEGTIAAA